MEYLNLQANVLLYYVCIHISTVQGFKSECFTCLLHPYGHGPPMGQLGVRSCRKVPHVRCQQTLRKFI
jgi:hypothetical protein